MSFSNSNRAVIVSISTLLVCLCFTQSAFAQGPEDNCMSCHFINGQSTWFPTHSDMGCSYCHVPHNSLNSHKEVPLWNPSHSETTLTGNYSSSSFNGLNSEGEQSAGPDGSSKLCLSCHDGTAAHWTHKFGDGGPMGELHFSHPISFVYDDALVEADGSLVSPSDLAHGVLDGNDKLQCSSCHDVHQSVTQSDSFLRWPYPTGNEAAFCTTCHIK